MFFLCCDRMNFKTSQRGEEVLHHENVPLKKAVLPDSTLGHMVFLKLREDLGYEPRDSLIRQIRYMDTITGVLHMKIGTRAKTGDPREITDHDLVFTLYFKDSLALREYDINPGHLTLKKNSKPYLAGPPQVYDFWLEGR